MREGRIFCAVGISRSGKSVWVGMQVSKYKRRFIWDIKGTDYDVDYRAYTPGQLIDLVKQHGRKSVSIAYTGKTVDFNFFCELAMIWVRFGDEIGQKGVVVIEETSQVTRPNYAPPAWATLCQQGLVYGSDIYAICQRTAESDKTALGNCSFLHVCKQRLPSDVAKMADELHVKRHVLGALVRDVDRNCFEFLQRDVDAGKTYKGKLWFDARQKPRLKIDEVKADDLINH